jgi:two-component sensor histidine kinase
MRDEWKGGETEELVRAQLAHLADLVGSRFAMHGPKLRLKAAGAQAIGLAAHELATNAEKYGALSTDTGRVDICWGVRWRHVLDELGRTWRAARICAQAAGEARVHHRPP